MSNNTNPLFWLFLLFAVAGAVVPWYFNLQHILYSPIAPSITEYYNQGTATPLAASLTWDLLIASTPAVIWMVVEGKRKKMKFVWAYVVLTFLVAFAFSFPLFLAMRERQIEKLNRLYL